MTQLIVICLKCLGGPEQIALEGEGMLRMPDYPWHMRDAPQANRGRDRRVREVPAHARAYL
jgi:hypothetical protein